jgi:hypothetical protein
MQVIIMREIINNDLFMRKVIPFIDPLYFEGVYKPLYLTLVKYVAKYNKIPTQETFMVYLPEAETFSGDTSEGLSIVPSLFDKEAAVDDAWMMDATEKWCQDRALFNAIMQSIQIIDGNDTQLSKNALPSILQKALSVTFDSNVGHDYLTSADQRYDFYHEQQERIPFDIDMFNKITKGGLIRKTLNVILAGTGVGKSLVMCHMAAANLSAGHNALYITCEMAEERIAERIDANLLDVPIDELEGLSKKMFKDRVGDIAAKTNGKLIIKEYPTGQANSGHFRALLQELKLKRKFVPDIVYIDYLNICSSSRMKQGGAVNSYTYIKAIAEELRGLAVEFNLPIVSATQINRTGFTSSDPGLEDTSESFGLPATADLMVALVTNDELDALGRVMVKQLKNRYADIGKDKRFTIGVDRPRMKVYDVDQDTEELVDDSIPVFDRTNAGKNTASDFASSLRFDA